MEDKKKKEIDDTPAFQWCPCEGKNGNGCIDCRGSVNQEIARLQKQVDKAKEGLRFYANTKIYNRPDRDREGMGGMSSRTDFEIDDGEWKITNGEKEHYCYGKLAREILKELGE